MHFVDTRDLDSIYGTTLMNEIRASIHPTGDCAICQEPLGTQPVRINAFGPGTGMATFVPTHRACGAPKAAFGSQDVLLTPPATFGTMWLLRSLEGRNSFGQTVHADLPMVVINPSLDVHASIEAQPGRWVPPIGPFHNLGLAAAFDRQPADLPHLPEGSQVTRTTHTLRITTVDTWTLDITDQFTSAVDDFGGFVLAISYRVLTDQFMTDPVTAFTSLMTAGRSAFAWVPAGQITRP